MRPHRAPHRASHRAAVLCVESAAQGSIALLTRWFPRYNPVSRVHFLMIMQHRCVGCATSICVASAFTIYLRCTPLIIVADVSLLYSAFTICPRCTQRVIVVVCLYYISAVVSHIILGISVEVLACLNAVRWHCCCLLHVVPVIILNHTKCCSRCLPACAFLY